MAFEVSSQPIASRMQVRGSRRSSCVKLQVGDSVVTEMAAVHLFHTTGNVTCTFTGQWYASLLQQSIIPVLQGRRCDTTTVLFKMVLLHTSPVVWNNCSVAISVMTESSARNFLQLGLLNPPTWILATFDCGNTLRPWSTVIPLHLYSTLKKDQNANA